MLPAIGRLQLLRNNGSLQEVIINASSLSIAYFVTPHGYGHAARATAVMQGLQRIIPHAHFDIFTEVPEWFFRSAMDFGYSYHRFASDVGLIQTSPFSEDLKATLDALKYARATQEQRLGYAVHRLRENNNQLVICDIAPDGIQAAKMAGLPSVLVENFTWDFIYAGYEAQEPALKEFSLYLREIFDSADVHIQTKPVCRVDENALQVEPVARNPKSSREAIRKQMQIPEDTPTILVTRGGIETQGDEFWKLKKFKDIKFILPGTSDQIRWDENLIQLPHHSFFYLPDVVYASDAIIGKLGYSTVAEIYRAGLPYAYIPRDGFAETRPMADFVQAEMNALELSYTDFANGNWGDLPGRLVSLPRIERKAPNGADQIADIISKMLRG